MQHCSVSLRTRQWQAPSVWLVLLPQDPIPRTVGATFKDVCDYMSASFNVKRVKILFWKYSLIFELTTPCDKGFDLWFWAYTALFEVTTPLYRDHMSSVHSSNGCGNPFFLVYAQFHFLKILSMDVLILKNDYIPNSLWQSEFSMFHSVHMIVKNNGFGI